MPVDDLSTRVEYRQIERLLGYRFGDDGSAWSCWKRVKTSGQGKGRRGWIGVLTEEWRRLSPSPSVGYWSVSLRGHEPGRFKSYGLHCLILEAFVGPRPSGGMECRHKDGDRKNNRLENLEWATPKVNNADKKLHGTETAGERHPMAKLTWAAVSEIRRLRAEGVTVIALAKRFGVATSNIYLIVGGKAWWPEPGR
jgi:HNH endonuclease